MEDHVRAAHVSALQMKGFHGGSFNHTCNGDTCIRPAHWRYFPELNPQLAAVAITGGAYEVYAVAGTDGAPAGTGYCILRLVDRLYTVAALITDYAEAVRLAAEMAIQEVVDT